MSLIDAGQDIPQTVESTFDASLFTNMQSAGDFDFGFDKLSPSGTNDSLKALNFPEVDFEFGSGKDSLSEKTDTGYDSPLEVAQTDLPPNSEPLNFSEQALSLRTVGLCSQGTPDNPYVLSVPGDRSVLYFTENDGDRVAVQKQLSLIADPEMPVPTRQAELVTKRLEFHKLAEGVTARVEMRPPDNELRFDHRVVSPKDNFQIFVIDENNGQAYKYSYDRKMNDGTELQKDLENLKLHYHPKESS